MARLPLHPGSKLLAPFVATQSAPTRSELEDGFLAFCKRFSLPRPETNVYLAGYLVDAFFPEHRLIVELDGYEFHHGRIAFESDRDRDVDTLLRGLATVRITWERMQSTPDKEAGRLNRILKARRRRAA